MIERYSVTVRPFSDHEADALTDLGIECVPGVEATTVEVELDRLKYDTLFHNPAVINMEKLPMTATLADRNLELRREEGKGKKIIRNESLRAGEPMFYYCRVCKDQSDKLPEAWDPREVQPKKICETCKQLEGIIAGIQPAVAAG